MKRFILLLFAFFLFQFSFSEITFPELVKEKYNDVNITADSLYQYISTFNDFPAKNDQGKTYLEYNPISDSLKAPYLFVIPEGYEHKEKTPLLVYLHGGIGRDDFIEEPADVMEENPFLDMVKNLNWFILFPMANKQTEWWDKSGIANLDYQIKRIKSEYNIDDDRVYVTGFSDGGSGSFHLALCSPDHFAAFYPLNGMLTVGSFESSQPVYLPNLRNHHLYAINTDQDLLYPASEMHKIMDLALVANADLFYQEYWGYGHDFGYAEDALPILKTDMNRHFRDPFPSKVYWECSDIDFGRIDWLEIIAIDSTLSKASWQKEYNTKLLDKRIQFGLFLNEESGKILITDLVENSAAQKMGLSKDDCILAMDGIQVKNIEELLNIRDSKNRGDNFSLTINRSGTELTLEGAFPDTTSYDAFNYGKPSGAVYAYYCANVFRIQTSRIMRITLYLSPQMINPKIPVKIIINDKIYFEGFIDGDKDVIWEEFKRNFDRSKIFSNKITLDI